MLALKHRQNKSQRQRVVVFSGSPLAEDEPALVRLGKKLKKNNVAVDVVAFAAIAENEAKLQARASALLRAARGSGGIMRAHAGARVIFSGVCGGGEQQQQQQPRHRAARPPHPLGRPHQARALRMRSAARMHRTSHIALSFFAC